MQRKQFCEVVDFDGGYYNTLRARGWLAIGHDDADYPERLAEIKRTWQRFDFVDAVIMRAQLDFMQNDGLTADEAAKAVTNSFGSQPLKWPERGQYISKLLEIGAQTPEFWIAREDYYPEGRAHYASTLAEIAKMSDARAAFDKKHEKNSEYARKRLVLVNLSRCVRFVTSRMTARKIGLFEEVKSP